MAEPLPLDELIALEALYTEEERMIRDTVRRFVRERYLPRPVAQPQTLLRLSAGLETDSAPVDENNL